MTTFWRPIETAPKDGSYVFLGYYPKELDGDSLGRYPEIAFWNGFRWLSLCGRRLNVVGYFSPTHWSPMPESPHKEKHEPSHDPL